LSVSATGGDYLIASFSPLAIAIIPFDASAGVVRQKLEGVFASRAVQVVEEPSGEENLRVFTITFPGQHVEVPFFDGGAIDEAFGGVPLSGGKAEVSVQQLQEGTDTKDEVFAVAENRGFASSSGRVDLSDMLPAGVQAVSVSGKAGGPGSFERPAPECTLRPLRCSFSAAEAASLPPFELLEMRVAVVPSSVKPGEVNTARVSGGGAVGTISAAHALQGDGGLRFGVEDWELVPESVGGTIDTQAGSHPFQLTNVTMLNNQSSDQNNGARSVGLAKDINGDLPPGFLGNPTPFTQCTDAQFAKGIITESNHVINECPEQAAVGVATVTYNQPVTTGFTTAVAPIFNMTPRHGEPIRFGFKAEGIVAAFLDSQVRVGSDYGVTISSSNITQAVDVLGVRLTFWGVPGDPRHDHERGWNCLQNLGGCPTTNNQTPPPFLVMPTSCGAPFRSTVRADSWGSVEQPAEEAQPLTYQLPEQVDGCNHLPFEPSIITTPDGTAASTPTGLTTDVHVPQTSVLQPHGLAESAVKDITVTLPEGVVLNPAGGDGLQACSETLAGYLPGESTPPGHLAFTPTLPEPLQQGVNFCPDASKVGTVKITLPIIPNPIEGAIYLATQNQNPFGSLIALYLVAEDPVSGVLVKLSGEVHLSPTGQITASFLNNPQAPFEDAELHFFGGAQAPLATPAHCGSYTTTASFAPWSENQAASSQSTFPITTGPHGSACPPTPLPFNPTLTAGTTNIQAGAYTPLTTTISREDGNQDLAAVQIQMPPGISGILAHVKLCPEAQANEGTCPAESLVGETTISAGLGPDPVTVTGGKVYLTEQYGSSPFGLSIVNPVKAGPFDLENTPTQHPLCDCIVVRAHIDIDHTTAQFTVTTDPPGSPHSIPQTIEGIPVQIKHVNVNINRPQFTFNPTNCDPQQITATLTSQQNTPRHLTIPLQTANCQNLAFKPNFKVSTNGHTSKANGASLTVKLTNPNTTPGTQTNYKTVKVELPKQLPSRLTTLQKACLAHTFETNPANCPTASIVGHAKVITPLLPVPLTGPAFFVSHGGEAFPSLTIVLQGYGVSVNLIGNTFINKQGITSTTYKTLPDVPFTAFELTLPQGKASALAANGNLCKTKHLTIPTTFTAQNNTQTHQNTPITATNCIKHHTKHKHHATKHHH
jgi:hypothetical protein